MNKQVNKTKGFTLIELLIVIAIIGILAGVVVVSLSGSTEAATEAGIKANLRSVDTVWKNDIISNNDISASTDGLCDNAAVQNIMESVVVDVKSLHSTTGNIATGTASDNKLWAQNAADDESVVGCFSSDDGWVAWARLSDDGTDEVYQCLDTSGFSGRKVGDDPNDLSDTSNPATPTCADSFS